jgi:hypothetical protein
MVLHDGLSDDLPANLEPQGPFWSFHLLASILLIDFMTAFSTSNVTATNIS